MNAIWGIASLAGPFLGGFLIDTLSWHWIFFINLPFGLLSVILLQKNLKESFVKRKPQIDYAGAAFLSLTILSFLAIFMLDGFAGLDPALFRGILLGAAAINSGVGYIFLIFVALSVLCIILTLMTPYINCDDKDAPEAAAH